MHSQHVLAEGFWHWRFTEDQVFDPMRCVNQRIMEVHVVMNKVDVEVSLKPMPELEVGTI